MTQTVRCGIICLLKHRIFTRALTRNRDTKNKAVIVVIENSLLAENVFRQFPENMLITIEESCGVVACHTKMLLHIDVEVLQHL